MNGILKLYIYLPNIEMQVGGVLIGTGMEGCIFKPALPCKSKKIDVDNMVSKVVLRTEDREYEKLLTISKIPAIRNYFIMPIKCQANQSNPDQDWDKCLLTGKPIRVIQLPYGGKTFTEFAEDYNWLSTNLMRVLLHLVEGLYILQKTGWRHTDIKSDNIVIDEKGVARFIDMGLAMNIKNLDSAELKKFTTYNLNWSNLPVEYQIFAARMDKIDLSFVKKQLYKKNLHMQYLEQMYPDRTSFNDAFVSIVRDDILPKNIEKYYEKYSDKMDAYCLGFMLYKQYYGFLQSYSAFPQSELGQQDHILRDIINGLTQFDPRERYSIGDVLYLLSPSHRLLPPKTRLRHR